MDFSPAPQDQFDQWELDLIKREARFFSHQHHLRWSDVEDLIAEGQIAWWRQRAKYDASRGASRRTYLNWVVRRAFADALKEEQARTRTASLHALSMDSSLPRDPVRALTDVIPAPDDLPDIAFALDVRGVLARLTPRQRAVVHGRVNGANMTDLAKQIGVHRDTLYVELSVIRSVFLEGGIRPHDPTDRHGRSHRVSGGHS